MFEPYINNHVKRLKKLGKNMKRNFICNFKQNLFTVKIAANKIKNTLDATQGLQDAISS